MPAIRPAPGRAADIIARPYDVLSFAEAKAGAAGRPWSFLHVSRAEIDLPADVDAHSDAVYAQAAKAFAARLAKAGIKVTTVKAAKAPAGAATVAEAPSAPLARILVA